MFGISRMCRLCGGSTEFGTSLLDPSRKNIADEATKLFLIEINPCNGFPSSLCPVCTKKVEDLMLLRSSCLITHRYFCRLLGVPNSCGIIESANVVKNVPDYQSSENIGLSEQDDSSEEDEESDETITSDLHMSEKSELLTLAISSSEYGLPKVINGQEIVKSSPKNDMMTNEVNNIVSKPPKRELRVVLTKINVEKYMSQLTNSQNETESESDPNSDQFVLDPDYESSQNVPKTKPNSPKKSKCHTTDSSLKDNDSTSDTTKLNHFCHVCKVVVTRTRDLKRHLHNNRVTCHYCHTEFASIPFLRHHMSVHHPVNPNPDFLRTKFICPACGKEESSLNDLKMHMVIHETAKHACNQCKHKFHSIRSLKHHIANVHHPGYKTIFKCFKCNEVFANETNLTRHIKCHHLSFYCNECGSTFESQILLIKHLNNTKHTQVKNNSHKIEDNPKIPIMTELNFETKMLLPHTTNKIIDLSLQNPIRNKIEFKIVNNQPQTSNVNTVRLPSGIFPRQKSVNNSEYNFKCKHCHTQFTDSSSLNFHVISNHSASIPKITRVILPSSVLPTNQYFSPEETSEPINSFRCSLCDVEFASRYLLSIHNDQFHIIKYRPVNIGYSFSEKANLQVDNSNNCSNSTVDSSCNEFPVEVKTEITVDEMDWSSFPQDK